MSASDVAGRHTISGLFRDEDKLESAVGGDDTVEVTGEAVAESGPSDSEGGVETEGEAGEAELGELEEGQQEGGDVTEDEAVQDDGQDGDVEGDEEPAVVWTTAGTGGRADVLPSPGTPNPALRGAAGEAFPLWLMLLLGVGGAIEVALIITVVRTRMWLALRARSAPAARFSR